MSKSKNKVQLKNSEDDIMSLCANNLCNHHKEIHKPEKGSKVTRCKLCGCQEFVPMPKYKVKMFNHAVIIPGNPPRKYLLDSVVEYDEGTVDAIIEDLQGQIEEICEENRVTVSEADIKIVKLMAISTVEQAMEQWRKEYKLRTIGIIPDVIEPYIKSLAKEKNEKKDPIQDLIEWSGEMEHEGWPDYLENLRVEVVKRKLDANAFVQIVESHINDAGLDAEYLLAMLHANTYGMHGITSLQDSLKEFFENMGQSRLWDPYLDKDKTPKQRKEAAKILISNERHATKKYKSRKIEFAVCPDCDTKVPNPKNLGELVCYRCGETFYLDVDQPDQEEGQEQSKECNKCGLLLKDDEAQFNTCTRCAALAGKTPEQMDKEDKGAIAMIDSHESNTVLKLVEDIQKSDIVSEKDKKKAYAQYEKHSKEFKKAYPQYVKAENYAVELFMKMVNDLMATGEYNRTSAIKKIVSDHKGVRGFSKATLYRNMAPELKRKWTRQQQQQQQPSLPAPEQQQQEEQQGDDQQLYAEVLKVRDQLISENKGISEFRNALVDVLPIGSRDTFMEYISGIGICSKDTSLEDAIFTIWQNGIRENDEQKLAVAVAAEQQTDNNTSATPSPRPVSITLSELDPADPGIYEDDTGITYRLSTKTGLDRIAEVIKAPEGVNVTAINWKGKNILKGAMLETLEKSQNATLPHQEENTSITGKIDGVAYEFTLDALMTGQPQDLNEANAMIAQFRKTLLPAYKDVPPGTKIFETYKKDIELMKELEVEREITKKLSHSLEIAHAENRRLNAENQELLRRIGAVERENNELKKRHQEQEATAATTTAAQ